MDPEGSASTATHSASVEGCRSGINSRKRFPITVYLCQIVLIYVVVITSLANLSFEHGDIKLWITLLCSSLGYLLPNPKVKGEK